MSVPGDSVDGDDRLTVLAVFEHECRAAADRGLLLDELLGRIDGTLGDTGDKPSQDDAAAHAQPEPVTYEDPFELVLRQRCYREAALPLAMLAGPITRSLADFLG